DAATGTGRPSAINTVSLRRAPPDGGFPGRAGRASWRVSRILSPPQRVAVIHLGLPLPVGSSGPPAGLGRAALERLRSHPGKARVGLDLAPGGVCRAIPVTRDAGGLLHHRFTLTARPVGSTGPRGGLFSVALSRESLRVAVSNHPALRSPDFPRDSPSRGRPANSPALLILLAA